VNRSLALLVLVSSLLLPQELWGDGVVIAPTAYAKVQVPDQSALISYDGATERMLIETSFIGAGTNFAWIVPVPTMPEVEVATAGVIPTLQITSRPVVYHNVPHIYGGILALGALVYLFATVRPTKRRTAGDFIACILLALGLGISLSWFVGFFSLLSIVAVGEARQGHSLIIGLALVFLISLFMGGLLLSAGATASSTTTGETVRIHERKIIGNFETAILSSPDGSALMQWLDKNGFRIPTNVTAAVSEYAREKWMFVAARVLRPEDTVVPTAPHPLVFTFKTDKPVYPLRLTGAGHDNCRVELYVFGPKRAAIPGFKVERCEQTSIKPGASSWAFPVRHPQILKLAANAPVFTNLSAQLRAEDMRTDGWISWEPFAKKRPWVFSYQGALIMTANLCMALLGLVAGFCWQKGMKMNRPLILKLTGLTVSTLLCAFLLLPKIEVTTTQMPRAFNKIYHHLLASCIYAAWHEHAQSAKPPFEPTLEWIRKQAEALSNENHHPRLTKENPFTGQPRREQDSPGNYVIRKAASGFEYVFYELDGNEQVIKLFE